MSPETNVTRDQCHQRPVSLETSVTGETSLCPYSIETGVTVSLERLVPRCPRETGVTVSLERPVSLSWRDKSHEIQV